MESYVIKSSLNSTFKFLIAYFQNSFIYFVWVNLESLVLVMLMFSNVLVNVILYVDADLKYEFPAFGAKDQNQRTGAARFF